MMEGTYEIVLLQRIVELCGIEFGTISNHEWIERLHVLNEEIKEYLEQVKK